MHRALVLTVALGCIACSETKPTAPVPNVTVPRDGGAMDGSKRAMDSGTGSEEVVWPDGCPPIAGSTPCSKMTDCGPNEICLQSGTPTLDLPTECMHCTPKGHPCKSNSDCANGSTCDGMCRPTEGTNECNDYRDCPRFFECEGVEGSRKCVDRRFSCNSVSACPPGYACLKQAEISTPFCTSGLRLRCTDSIDCPPQFQCVDAYGDGNPRCYIGGSCGGLYTCECEALSECGENLTCGFDFKNPSLKCGAIGPCIDEGDCPADHSCKDVRGDGLKVCHPDESECDSNSDCAPQELCFVGIDDDKAKCHQGQSNGNGPSPFP
ncbi:MAG: hypothetical protein KC416_12065 [Myxococcales bacterium]|nr:hypothetical protein [Myxococcales bacterium]